jgi:hypothetical protein
MNPLAAKREAFCRVLWSWLLEDGPSTARELAAKHPRTDERTGQVLGPRSIEGIRPRLSELLKDGEIRVVGHRGGGLRGPKEAVFEAVNRWEESGEATPAPATTAGEPRQQRSLLEEYGIA